MVSGEQYQPLQEKPFFVNEGIIAVALCGGRGTRMREVTQDQIPKPLIPLQGRKLIDYSIDPLLAAGIKNYLFAAGHLADQIQSYAHQKFPDQENVFVAKNPVTTEGVVVQTRYAMKQSNISGPTVLFDCDAVRLGLDFAKAYAFHQEKKADVTFVGVRVRQPQESNFVIFEDSEYRALALALHPEAASVENDALIKCGMMICSDRATQMIREDSDMLDSWISMIEVLSTLGNSFVHVASEMLLYVNVNTPEDLAYAKHQLALLPADNSKT